MGREHVWAIMPERGSSPAVLAAVGGWEGGRGRGGGGGGGGGRGEGLEHAYTGPSCQGAEEMLLLLVVLLSSSSSSSSSTTLPQKHIRP